jgi:hypothetical protein
MLEAELLSSKNVDGVQLCNLKECKVLATKTFTDWKIKAGKKYKVHIGEHGPLIYVGGFFNKEGVDLAYMYQTVLNTFIIL